MTVLIVKTSSMGDIIHTLPALTDAMQARPGIQFDWVVEKAFAEIPAWHPAVARVIPVGLRAWRKQLFSRVTWQASRAFYRDLRAQNYTLVIDAQGLPKSAVIARLAQGVTAGPDWRSARDSVAALFYQQRLRVPFDQHAVDRARQLFAQALGYPLPDSPPDYGIDRTKLAVRSATDQPYLVFLHGTTWETKHWPEAHWKGLARRAIQQGYQIRLPWGNPAEEARAHRIASVGSDVTVLPRQTLAGMAAILAGAKGVVSVDTGFGHLTAALAVPAVSLYGPTSPALNGALGPSQTHLSASLACSPCFGRQCSFRGEIPLVAGERLLPPCLAKVSPDVVWTALEQQMSAQVQNR